MAYWVHKIWSRLGSEVRSANKKLLVQKWKSLYRNRLLIHSEFYFGRACNILLDISKSKVVIGDRFEVRDNFEIRCGNDGNLQIGNQVFFNNGCSLHCLQKITIGNHNQFGEGVKMYDHNHQHKQDGDLISNQGYTTGSIKIGNNCWLGTNVIVLKNVEIGDNVIIGAGCIIYKSVPSNTIVLNNQNLEFIPR